MIQDNCRFSDNIRIETGKGFNSEFLLKVNMKLELFDKDGKLKDVREVHNTVTTAGKNGIMDQILLAPTLPKPGWMELGTGTPSGTLLGAYIVNSRVAFTSKLRTDNVVTMVGDWGAGSAISNIIEAGIFDVVTQNTVNMWCSSTFAVVNKAVNDTLKITWTLTGN